ncbi:mitochondrial import protein, putative [Paecilomyces variotii No. 5]|uniref:Mitochondrial import protein, putative n=1 Tax=Byssochlamys spectabilis (strain No. 5 / NBRC 109023) TaxID=1356009 RepID=V5I230_BYSSN|nr:mitochondrial import protein, putative [Paecilomyces variotii No. 5]
MASEDNGSSRVELYESGLTVPSDSENYSANHEMSSSPPSTSSSPLILYKPPTLWSILRGAAINLVLPFVNGLMLGFGELLAHEAAFRLGWSGTKVRLYPIHLPLRLGVFCLYRRPIQALLTCFLQIFPSYRRSRPVGPGIEAREIPTGRRRGNAVNLDDAMSLE